MQLLFINQIDLNFNYVVGLIKITWYHKMQNETYSVYVYYSNKGQQ